MFASVILKKDLTAWFAELNVEMNKIRQIVRSIMDLYDMWNDFDEKKEITDLLLKMPKPKVILTGIFHIN